MGKGVYHTLNLWKLFLLFFLFFAGHLELDLPVLLMLITFPVPSCVLPAGLCMIAVWFTINYNHHFSLYSTSRPIRTAAAVELPGPLAVYLTILII